MNGRIVSGLWLVLHGKLRLRQCQPFRKYFLRDKVPHIVWAKPIRKKYGKVTEETVNAFIADCVKDMQEQEQRMRINTTPLSELSSYVFDKERK